MNNGVPLTPAQKRARLLRGMFLLPSLFTVGNIGAGYFAIIQTFAAIGANADAHTHLDWAAMAIQPRCFRAIRRSRSRTGAWH